MSSAAAGKTSAKKDACKDDGKDPGHKLISSATFGVEATKAVSDSVVKRKFPQLGEWREELSIIAAQTLHTKFADKICDLTKLVETDAYRIRGPEASWALARTGDDVKQIIADEDKVLMPMVQTMRREAIEISRMAGQLRMWMQLCVPKMETGDNMGVEVQDEFISQLATVEQDAAKVITQGVANVTGRGEVLVKLKKYPNHEDYARCALELLYRSRTSVCVALRDTRNNYLVLLDACLKNLKYLTKPKAQTQSSNLMTMF